MLETANHLFLNHGGFVVFCVVFSVIILHIKRATKEFESTVDSLASNLRGAFDGIVPDEYLVDVKYVEKENDPVNKSQCIKVKVIGNQYRKGYDFLRCTYKQTGCTEEVPLHRHSKTAEFFVAIKGSFIVYKEGLPEVAAPGTSVFIPSKTNHSLEFTEDCEFIMIAKPPLFSRIGKLYEKIWERFRKKA